jgi:hypothetical protein
LAELSKYVQWLAAEEGVAATKSGSQVSPLPAPLLINFVILLFGIENQGIKNLKNKTKQKHLN